MTARELLPQRRACENFELTFAGFIRPLAVTVGRYDDGRCAEVFINAGKSGEQVETIARDSAILLSLAFQHGVPIEVIAGAVTRDLSGAPQTIVGAVVDVLRAQVGAVDHSVAQNASRETGGDHP